MKETTKIILFFGTILCALGGLVLFISGIGPHPHIANGTSGLVILAIGLVLNGFCLIRDFPEFCDLLRHLFKKVK